MVDEAGEGVGEEGMQSSVKVLADVESGVFCIEKESQFKRGKNENLKI